MDTLNTLRNLVEYLTVNSAAGIGLPMQNPRQRKTVKLNQESKGKNEKYFDRGLWDFYHFSGILPGVENSSEITTEVSRDGNSLGTICNFWGKPNGKLYNDTCQPNLSTCHGIWGSIQFVYIWVVCLMVHPFQFLKAYHFDHILLHYFLL